MVRLKRLQKDVCAEVDTQSRLKPSPWTGIDIPHSQFFLPIYKIVRNALSNIAVLHDPTDSSFPRSKVIYIKVHVIMLQHRNGRRHGLFGYIFFSAI